MPTAKRPYSRPAFTRAPRGLSFVLAFIRAGWTVSCRQCSSCHGCR